MKLHEYQAKQLFAQYGLTVPQGKVAFTPDEAQGVANGLGGPKVVVKAQVHIGGRGKAGGVKVVDVPDAKGAAEKILGMDIKGFTVKKVLVEKGIDIRQEFYLSFTLDRAKRRIILIASAAGGMDIEEVAEKTPEKVIRVWIDPLTGLKDYHVREVLQAFDPAQHAEVAQLVKTLYRIYLDKDLGLIEINPLVLTGEGKLICADGKVDIDDNAMFRHPELEEWRDLSEENPLEVKAKEAGLSFVQLEGDIGCVVNGAGLAMATMDTVKYFGGQPANFLDIGGSSNPDKVVKAMEILMANPGVKAILFNIFGGITRCDDVARGLVTALGEMQVSVPIVIRLTGTNEEEARNILQANGLSAYTSMTDAVKAVIEASKQPVGA